MPTELTSYALPGSVTIENIERITADLSGVTFQKGVPFTLDVGATSVITTPGIQLLLAMMKAAARAETQVDLANAKDNLIEALNDLGFFSQLDG